MITIQNMHTTKPKEPYDIKVDRTSILGSPFHLASEADRNAVCDQYDKWFTDCVSSSPGKRITMKAELARLCKLHTIHNQLNLFCWCVPKRCHAETIKHYLEAQIE